MPLKRGYDSKENNMAQNLIACGDRIDYTVPASTTIASGDPVLIGDKLGVALVSGTEGDIIAVQLEGVFELPKKTHAADEALTLGAPVYFDAVAKKVTKASAAKVNKHIGYAFAAAGSTAATAQILLASSANEPQAVNVAQITTVNGSDAATTQTLANDTKTSVNAILTALKAAGIMVADA